MSAAGRERAIRVPPPTGAALSPAPARRANGRARGSRYDAVRRQRLHHLHDANHTDHGYSSQRGNSYWGADPGRDCTNYVAFVESTVNAAAYPGNGLGDAKDWGANAAVKGHPRQVDLRPRTHPRRRQVGRRDGGGAVDGLGDGGGAHAERRRRPGSRECGRVERSALDDVHREAAAGGLLVLDLHVGGTPCGGCDLRFQ